MKAVHLLSALMAMVVSVLGATPSPAKEVGGIEMPEVLKAEEAQLILNGAGVREKFFMDLYVAGLYLTGKESTAQEIIRKDEPMAIRMEIISSMITGDKMAEATREGFVKSTNGNVTPIQAEIDSLIKVFMEDIEKGDIYDLVYTPGEGTRVYKNSEMKAVVKGLQFKQALFGIWLSDDPVQKNLKKDLLGD